MFSGMTSAFATCELGTIDDHDDEVFGMSGTDLGEKLPHQLGVHLPADHPIQLSLQRADGPIHIREFPLIAVVHHRSSGTGAQQRRMRSMRPKRASSWNISRTLRPWTTSGVSRVSSTSGSFFQSSCTSGLLWDNVCRVPPCANRGAPEADRPRRV